MYSRAERKMAKSPFMLHEPENTQHYEYSPWEGEQSDCIKMNDCLSVTFSREGSKETQGISRSTWKTLLFLHQVTIWILTTLQHFSIWFHDIDGIFSLYSAAWKCIYPWKLTNKYIFFALLIWRWHSRLRNLRHSNVMCQNSCSFNPLSAWNLLHWFISPINTKAKKLLEFTYWMYM